MLVRCFTNLDLFNESWPTELPSVPRVGDLIESAVMHPSGFKLRLEVVSVTWVSVVGDDNRHQWIPEIELHMTRFHKGLPSHRGAAQGSITAFYEWYAPLVGKRASYFI